MNRAAAINAARVGAQKIWAGTVTIHPNAKTGAHHHGALESVIYVVRGQARMRWGEHLEFTAEAGPGDFIFVPPYVPHQEINASTDDPLECVLVRSDNEAVVVNLNIDAVEAARRGLLGRSDSQASARSLKRGADAALTLTTAVATHLARRELRRLISARLNWPLLQASRIRINADARTKPQRRSKQIQQTKRNRPPMKTPTDSTRTSRPRPDRFTGHGGRTRQSRHRRIPGRPPHAPRVAAPCERARRDARRRRRASPASPRARAQGAAQARRHDPRRASDAGGRGRSAHRHRCRRPRADQSDRRIPDRRRRRKARAASPRSRCRGSRTTRATCGPSSCARTSSSTTASR